MYLYALNISWEFKENSYFVWKKYGHLYAKMWASVKYFECRRHFTEIPKAKWTLSIGFGDNTDLLWWNNVNNQFYQLTTRVSYQRGIRRPFKCTGNHTYWGLKITEACNPKMVFKICEGIPCSSFSVKELDVIVHEKIFSLYNYVKFWPFCTPHHQRTWWLRWELGIVTRSNCSWLMYIYIFNCYVDKSSCFCFFAG